MRHPFLVQSGPATRDDRRADRWAPVFCLWGDGLHCRGSDLDAALRTTAQSYTRRCRSSSPCEQPSRLPDITGFGLLGHLGEMLSSQASIKVELEVEAILAYGGAMNLLEQGVCSTLAPSNRSAWRWLDGPVQLRHSPSAALLELLVDPQTCGPLLLACHRDAVSPLMATGRWFQIGNVTTAHG